MTPAKSKTTREAMGYIRVSKTHGREGARFHSPEMQLDIVKRAVTDADGKFVGYRYDPDRSGYADVVREGWEECVDWIMESPRTRMIVAYDTSRLSRNLWKLLGDIQHKIVPAGGRVIVAGDGIDTDVDGWQDKMQMLGMFAERFSREIGKKWTGVLDRRADAKKHPTGKVPYGYRAVVGADGKPTGDLVPEPETAAIMREMYRLYNGGSGLRQIANEFNERLIAARAHNRAILDAELTHGFPVGEAVPENPSPGGSTWATSTIKRLLENGAAAGLLRFRGELTEAGWDPLISDVQWRAFQVEAKRRAKVPNRTKAPRWPLAGIAVCALCGSRLTVTSLTSASGLAACSTYRTRGRNVCSGVSITRGTLDAQFTYFLMGHAETLAHRVTTKAQKAEDAKATEVESRAATARETLENLSTARTRLGIAWAEGNLSDAEYRDALRDNDEKAEAARQDLEGAELTIADSMPIEDAADALVKHGEGISDAEWRQVLRRTVDRVVVSRDEIRFVPVMGDPKVVDRKSIRNKPGRKPKAAA
jgi:DNA invertase Pin-like site-specific DNA recombinase